MNKIIVIIIALMVSIQFELSAYACGCSAPSPASAGEDACTIEVTYNGSANCCQAWGPVGGSDFAVYDCFGEELYSWQDTGSGGVAFCSQVGSISC